MSLVRPRAESVTFSILFFLVLSIWGEWKLPPFSKRNKDGITNHIRKRTHTEIAERVCGAGHNSHDGFVAVQYGGQHIHRPWCRGFGNIGSRGDIPVHEPRIGFRVTRRRGCEYASLREARSKGLCRRTEDSGQRSDAQCDYRRMFHRCLPFVPRPDTLFLRGE